MTLVDLTTGSMKQMEALDLLSPALAERVRRFIEFKLTEHDPEKGKRLPHEVPTWRYKVGSARIVAQVEDGFATVLAVGLADR